MLLSNKRAPGIFSQIHCFGDGHFTRLCNFIQLLGMLLLVSAMLGLVTSLSDLHVQESPHNARENVSAGASLGLKVRKVILFVEVVAISTPICSSLLIQNVL